MLLIYKLTNIHSNYESRVHLPEGSGNGLDREVEIGDWMEMREKVEKVNLRWRMRKEEEE